MHVADGIERFEDQGVVNWYLVETDDGPVAVDAGFPTAWKQIEPRVRRAAGDRPHPRARRPLRLRAEGARRRPASRCTCRAGDEQIVRNPLPIRQVRAQPAAATSLNQGPTRRAVPAGAALRRHPRRRRCKDVRLYDDGDELPGGLAPSRRPATPTGTWRSTCPTATWSSPATRSSRSTPTPTARARGSSPARRRRTPSAPGVARRDRRDRRATVLTGHGEPWTDGAAGGRRPRRAAPTWPSRAAAPPR